MKRATVKIILCSAVLALVIASVIFVFPDYFAVAAEVAVDTSIHTTPTSHNGGSPTVVFISDQTGYAFYRDASGSCVYSKTSNGGTSWGAAVTVDAQTDCLRVAVWYDRWTPGDTTGTYIYIATLDAADLWYTRLDTASDTLTATVNATGANQGGGFAVGANVQSITKGMDGDIYMGIQDAGDSFVIKCLVSADCSQAINWTEAGANPFDLATDWLILMPLSGGNILAIRWDISADDVQSKVYNDSANSWDASWAAVDLNAIEDGTYDAHFGATLKKSTGDIYLAYVADVATFGTNDDIRAAVYSGGAWTAKTDILTNDAKGLTGVKVGLDENTNEIYAVYTARTTPGTAATGNVYYKKSADGMTSWGAEQGAVNVTAGDLYGARVNAMSNERLYVTWDLPSADDLLGNTIVDLASTDTTAPAAVSDLALSSAATNSLTVSWTAPGDDGSTGTANSYDLRYSTSVITAGNFSSATTVTGEPAPSVAGSLESMSVTGLLPSTTYYFAIKTLDEVPNTSAISNVPSLATLAGPASPTAAPAATLPGAGPQTVNFSGRAYPGARVSLIEKIFNENVLLTQGIPVSENGDFRIGGLPPGFHAYGLLATDKEGRQSQAKIYNVEFIYENLTVSDVLFSPTVEMSRSLVSQGDAVKVIGSAYPGSRVVAIVDDGKTYETGANEKGEYQILIDGDGLNLGGHFLKVKQQTPAGQESDFSLTKNFTVSSIRAVEADLNVDGAIDIRDWSIFLAQWARFKADGKAAMSIIDLNKDGQVNISDLGIFLKAFNKLK